MSKPRDGGPAFPQPLGAFDRPAGMSLRDWFATFASEPSDEAVKFEAERDRLANPHGDTYKPRRREVSEIRASLRYRHADAMLAAREQEPPA